MEILFHTGDAYHLAGTMAPRPSIATTRKYQWHSKSAGLEQHLSRGRHGGALGRRDRVATK